MCDIIHIISDFSYSKFWEKNSQKATSFVFYILQYSAFKLDKVRAENAKIQEIKHQLTKLKKSCGLYIIMHTNLKRIEFKKLC